MHQNPGWQHNLFSQSLIANIDCRSPDAERGKTIPVFGQYQLTLSISYAGKTSYQ
jgi:hypothetical protein